VSDWQTSYTLSDDYRRRDDALLSFLVVFDAFYGQSSWKWWVCHLHVTHCSSGQAHSSSQTASRSVQPFLNGPKMLCCTIRCQWGKKTPKTVAFPWYFVTLPEEHRSTAIGNIHRKFGCDQTCRSGEILVERQTERYTDILGGLQGDECVLCYTMLHITRGAIANLSTRICYSCRWTTTILSGSVLP